MEQTYKLKLSGYTVMPPPLITDSLNNEVYFTVCRYVLMLGQIYIRGWRSVAKKRASGRLGAVATAASRWRCACWEQGQGCVQEQSAFLIVP